MTARHATFQSEIRSEPDLHSKLDFVKVSLVDNAGRQARIQVETKHC